MPTTYSKAYRWCFRRLDQYLADYMECGEIITTRLGEDCADALDAYADDDTIPDFVWDAAHDAAERYLES